MGKGERREYPAEFKRAAVELITDNGDSVADAARRIGVNESLLRRWKRQLDEDGAAAFPGKGRRRPQSEELHRLREANRRLVLEREILRLAGAVLQGSIGSRYAFIHDHCSNYPTSTLCEVLGVSRSGYYAYARARSASPNHDQPGLGGVPGAFTPPSATRT